MRRILIGSIVTILLVLGWVALRHSGGSPPVNGEEAPMTGVSANREIGHRNVFLDENAPISQPEAATNRLVSSNLYARLSNDGISPVSRERLESYLARNQRSAEALLGALRASGGDDTFLAEAKERFPNDPRVQFAAAFKSESAEERRGWLEKMKQSDPDNALANYLIANEHAKGGQTDEALQEINDAAGKHSFQNYLLDFIQNAEEAYQAAGYSTAEAKAIASVTALLPEQARLKELGVKLVDLAKGYQQSGDETSARGLLQMGLDLGRRIDESPQGTLIQTLVGMAIERKALEAMDPQAPYDSTGQTVQERLDALAARKNSYRELTTQSDPILMTMSNEEVANYFDRFTRFGDVAAMRWVINKSSQP